MGSVGVIVGSTLASKNYVTCNWTLVAIGIVFL